MRALILTGGIGTRLRPLTCNTPKPLLPILNMPFINYQLELLQKHGVDEVILCTNYKFKQFDKFARDYKKMKIICSYEKKFLGTGGGIKNAERYIDENESFFVLNGDILTDINLAKMLKFHRRKNSKASIALTRVTNPTAYGLVETKEEGKIKRFLEKPSWDEVTTNTINAGIYLFDPQILKYIPPKSNYSLERDLFPSLLHANSPIYGYVTSSYWLDIGNPKNFLQAHFDIFSGKLKLRKIKQKITIGKASKISEPFQCNGKVIIGDNSNIQPYVTFNGYVCIGNNCYLGKGVEISNSVVLDGTIISDGVKLQNCIVGRNCKIKSYATLSSYTVLSDNSRVNKYSKL